MKFLISLILLLIFGTARLSNLFPAYAWVEASISLIITAILGYWTYSIFWRRPSDFLENIIVFFFLKWMTYAFLIYNFPPAPFNPHFMGTAWCVFVAIEIFTVLVTVVTLITQHSWQRKVANIGCGLGSFFVSAALLLLVTLTSHNPRDAKLKADVFMPALSKRIQVWFYDYGGTAAEYGGIHCQAFELKQFGPMAKLIKLSAAEQQYLESLDPQLAQACRGVY